MVDNVHELTPAERQAAGIARLPETMAEALELMERSELVAEALSRKLGFPISPAQIGYPGQSANDWRWDVDPVAQLNNLAGTQRRQVLNTAIYSLAALSPPRLTAAPARPAAARVGA